MKKLWFAAAGLVAAAGVFYLSRTATAPHNEQVQGAMGARMLSRGATVCVNRIQNLSEKDVPAGQLEEDLVDQLNQAGFHARLNTAGGDKPCEASVYGEIVNVKGKDSVQAEFEYRLVRDGEQAPFLSATAKGKARAVKSPEEARPAMANSFVASRPDSQKNLGAARHDAILDAFAEMAKQVEGNRPVPKTRAALD
ncbi:MAG: hypothetical protein U0Q16_04575 [Bryobacteraceae bacterium]